MAFRHLISLVKSPASLYVVLRYVTYALQFINSILLVNVLGDFSYGIYGFILMFTVYFIYLNLGINDALNAEYAINKSNTVIRKGLWDNAISLCLVWYSIILISSIIILHIYPSLFSKYNFSAYSILLILACIIHNFSILFATLYKIHGKTLKVNIEQLLPQLGILLLIMGGKKVASINTIVMVILGSNVVSFILYCRRPPEKYFFSLKFGIIKRLLKRGISLLLYNLSFQLLTMLALGVVSYLYSVEQMGCYSLANSITNGVLMAGGAFLFIFFPKIINRMSESREGASKLITKFENIYIVFIDCVSIVSIICVWGLSFAYPSYGSTFVKLYIFLIIARIINNSAIGFSTYLISIKKETYLVICGLSSLLLSAVGYWFINLYTLPIVCIPQVIILACICFSCAVICIGQRELYGKLKKIQLLNLILGQSKWIILTTGIIYLAVWDNYIVLLSGIAAYFIINSQKIIYSVRKGYKIVADKSALNF